MVKIILMRQFAFGYLKILFYINELNIMMGKQAVRLNC
jgi:hypothetical protein